MTERKLTAVALTVFIVVAALTGGATVAIFTDEESIGVNFGADVAGNTGTDDGQPQQAGSSGGSEDTTDTDTTTEDNTTATGTDNTTNDSTTTTTTTTTTATTTTTTTTTTTATTTTTTKSAGNTQRSRSTVGLFAPTQLELLAREGSAARSVGLDEPTLVSGTG